MTLPLYLAMTPPEIRRFSTLPEKLAYMACHFSPSGPGLTNLPQTLPPGSLLILDDSYPPSDHDPELVLKQLTALVQRLQPAGLLLDFQRPYTDLLQQIAKLSSQLPCPVGVTPIYAKSLPCPVFLPPVPPDVYIKDYLSPWQGRQIWLEAAPSPLCLVLTDTGCVPESPDSPPEEGFCHQGLFCHYTVKETPEGFRFTLWRTKEDLALLLAEGAKLGVSAAAGLFQELRNL